MRILLYFCAQKHVCYYPNTSAPSILSTYACNGTKSTHEFLVPESFWYIYIQYMVKKIARIQENKERNSIILKEITQLQAHVVVNERAKSCLRVMKGAVQGCSRSSHRKGYKVYNNNKQTKNRVRVKLIFLNYVWRASAQNNRIFEEKNFRMIFVETGLILFHVIRHSLCIFITSHHDL